jgi:putative membrane protein
MPNFVLPVLHGGVGYPTGRFHSNWSPEPTVVLLIVVLVGAYIAWTGPLARKKPDAAERITTRKHKTYFILGSIAYLIALGPPLDDWSDHYLLSAHMFQHLLLMYVAVPLWLAGVPGWVYRPLVQNRVINMVCRELLRPVPAYVIANILIIVWHLPPLYNAGLEHVQLHVLQHMSFVVAAIFAWWSVLSPVPEWPRLQPLVQCLYLFAETIPSGAVGAFVTMAAPGVYSFYDNVPRLWGIGLADDQEAAGLMMWVAGSFIYLLWITVIFFKWAAREEAKEHQPTRPAAVRS